MELDVSAEDVEIHSVHWYNRIEVVVEACAGEQSS